jgi:hypothetical protein
MRIAIALAVAFTACAPHGYYTQPSAPAGPSCTGGAVPSGDQCVCPDGTSWDDSQQQCVGAPQAQGPTCNGGAVPSGDQCVCPDGTGWDDSQQQCVGTQAQVQPAGCPDGTSWDGSQCVASAPVLPTSGPDVTVTVIEHRSTDEIGKSCTSDSPGYPTAGTCQYGAVCFRRVCTVWCANDRSCPSGLRCAMTGSPENTELCQR